MRRTSELSPPRDDGRPGSAALQGHRSSVEAQLSELPRLAVAAYAASLENRKNFFLEINRVGDRGQLCERVR